MKRNAILIGGLLCLLGLIGVTAADLLQPPDGAGPTANDAVPAEGDATATPQVAEEDQQLPEPDLGPSRVTSYRGRALQMDSDGFVVGRVSDLDPYTLNLEPVPEAVVTFMQNMAIVTQAKTGSDGRFAVKGLSAHATYSVFVSSPEWVAVLGTFVERYEEGAIEGSPFHRNQLSFTGAGNPALLEHADGDPKFQAIQCVPWNDFFSAFQMGIFGDLCQQDVPFVAMPGPRGESGGGYVEGAYGAAFVAAAAGAIQASKQTVASPFDP
jgi:hypothetical protein